MWLFYRGTYGRLPTMISALVLAAAVAASYANPDQLVETDWVAAHFRDRGVRVVDMRRSGYETGHVPGAVHLPPDSIRDANNPPAFVPGASAFNEMMTRLGISNETRVIVYDDRGGVYAARLWWLLNYYGHRDVALMNGGWTKWTAERRQTTTDVPPAPAAATFTGRVQPQWLATAEDVVAAINKPGARILDARTAAEIGGATQPNIKRGGIVPSSVPVYWEDLLESKLRTFKAADDLQDLFRSAGVLPSDEVIVYCLVGMRASVDLFALHLLGYDKLRNYYGSWEEWGNRDDLPIAQAPRR